MSSLETGRFGRIRKITENIKKNISEDPESILFERGIDPHMERPPNESLGGYGKKGETRRRVAKQMFEVDKDLSEAKKSRIIERMINRYFEVSVQNPDLRGHVEAPHGIRPTNPELRSWCKAHGITTYEEKTAEITRQCQNFAVFQKPRLTVDINSLTREGETAPISERAVLTREDNLTAIAAQRLAIARILRETNNLTENNQAQEPHLAIFLHGKGKTGEDIIIGAKQDREGKGLLHPFVALWIQEQLQELMQEHNITHEGKTPRIKVMTTEGKFSGSPALKRLRYGDDIFNFQGFGEMLQCLQIECSLWIRKQHTAQMAEVLNELMTRFQEQFSSGADFEALAERFEATYRELHEQQTAEIIDSEKIFLSPGVPTDCILMAPSVHEFLEVEVGDVVDIAGTRRTVGKMKRKMLKSGNMALHPDDEFLKAQIDTIRKV